MMKIEYADEPQSLLSDGMIECAICQQDISIGCSYRNSDAGTVHDMESDCAANLGFVFDALEKAEAQIAEQTQLHHLEATRANQLLAPRVVLLEAQLATARQDAFADKQKIEQLGKSIDGLNEQYDAALDTVIKIQSGTKQVFEVFINSLLEKANSEGISLMQKGMHLAQIEALKAVRLEIEAASQPIPKPPVQLSTEAAQGCECENCRDERRARNYGLIYDAGRGEHISGCICHDCHLKRQA